MRVDSETLLCHAASDRVFGITALAMFGQLHVIQTDVVSS